MNSGLKKISSRQYKTGDVLILKSSSPRPVGWVKDGEQVLRNSPLYEKLQTSDNPYIVWTTRTSNFGFSTINSVRYGNGLWVAVGASGRIRTSTDTVTWATQTSNFGTSTIASVIYADGIFVAAGNGGTIRTSTDAVTWATNPTFLNPAYGITHIAYANSLWVVAAASSLFTSRDLITWVTQETGLTDNGGMRSPAYGNGLWVVPFSISTGATFFATADVLSPTALVSTGLTLSDQLVAYIKP